MNSHCFSRKAKKKVAFLLFDGKHHIKDRIAKTVLLNDLCLNKALYIV